MTKAKESIAFKAKFENTAFSSYDIQFDQDPRRFLMFRAITLCASNIFNYMCIRI